MEAVLALFNVPIDVDFSVIKYYGFNFQLQP